MKAVVEAMNISVRHFVPQKDPPPLLTLMSWYSDDLGKNLVCDGLSAFCAKFILKVILGRMLTDMNNAIDVLQNSRFVFNLCLVDSNLSKNLNRSA